MATTRARRSAALAVALLGAVPLTGPTVTAAAADTADTCGTVEPEPGALPDPAAANPWGCDDVTRPGLTVPGGKVRELRLIAPRRGGLGRVQVRIGSSRWQPVNLSGAKNERFHVYVVRDQYSPLVGGTIRIRVASTGKVVRVGAVLARR